jgi:hypothetical protein
LPGVYTEGRRLDRKLAWLLITRARKSDAHDVIVLDGHTRADHRLVSGANEGRRRAASAAEARHVMARPRLQRDQAEPEGAAEA